MSSIESFLINATQHLIHLLRIHPCLFLVLIRQFLLRASTLEGGVVRHDCEVQSIMS